MVGLLNDFGSLHADEYPTAVQQLKGFAAMRLRVARNWEQHPEILDEEITQPFFLIGKHLACGARICAGSLPSIAIGSSCSTQISEGNPTDVLRASLRACRPRRAVFLTCQNTAFAYSVMPPETGITAPATNEPARDPR